MKKAIFLSALVAVAAAHMVSSADAAQPRTNTSQYVIQKQTIKPQGPGSFATPTGGYPTYSQITGKRAKILLRHEQNSNGGKYALKGSHANKTVQIKIAANCPAGQAVRHLAYQIGSQSVPVYRHNSNTGPNVVKKTINVVPFDEAAILWHASIIMGHWWEGSFPADNSDRKKTKQTFMVKKIKLISSCSGPGSTKVKDYMINIPKVTIIDTDYE